jgi:hypothetical protein
MPDMIKMEDVDDEVLDAPTQQASACYACYCVCGCMVDDEPLDTPTQKAVAPCCHACGISDEPLDAPQREAVPTLCICHIPPPPCSFCTVSDEIDANVR